MSFLKQQFYRLAIVAALLSVVAVPASAQELKIGVVNIPALMQRAPQTKAAMDALQEEFAPRQRDIVAKQKEFEDLAAKFQKDEAVMGETERRNMENELRELQREVSRLQNDFQEDLNLRQNEEMSNLQVSLLQEIQGYAAQEGYDLLVGDGVLYASGAVNITEQVLRAVEANFQALNTAP
jgi:outer membrane protein